MVPEVRVVFDPWPGAFGTACFVALKNSSHQKRMCRTALCLAPTPKSWFAKDLY